MFWWTKDTAAYPACNGPLTYAEVAGIPEPEEAEEAEGEGGEAIPAELKDTVRGALEAYTKANNAPMEILEKRFMAMAKTDEEKAFVQQMMDETKAEEQK